MSSAARCWCQACADLAAFKALAQCDQVSMQAHNYQRLGFRNYCTIGIYVWHSDA